MPRGAAYKVEAPGVCRRHGEAWKEPGNGAGAEERRGCPRRGRRPKSGQTGRPFSKQMQIWSLRPGGPGRPGGALGGGEAGLTRGAPSVASRRKPRNREGAGGIPPRPQVVTATQGPGMPALGGRRAAGRGRGRGRAAGGPRRGRGRRGGGPGRAPGRWRAAGPRRLLCRVSGRRASGGGLRTGGRAATQAPRPPPPLRRRRAAPWPPRRARAAPTRGSSARRSRCTRSGRPRRRGPSSSS